MTEEDDVEPENPCPEGYFSRFRDNEWHYVPDELAQTISLGPGSDGEEGQDWMLTYTPENSLRLILQPKLNTTGECKFDFT